MKYRVAIKASVEAGVSGVEGKTLLDRAARAYCGAMMVGRAANCGRPRPRPFRMGILTTLALARSAADELAALARGLQRGPELDPVRGQGLAVAATCFLEWRELVLVDFQIGRVEVNHGHPGSPRGLLEFPSDGAGIPPLVVPRHLIRRAFE